MAAPRAAAGARARERRRQCYAYREGEWMISRGVTLTVTRKTRGTTRSAPYARCRRHVVSSEVIRRVVAACRVSANDAAASGMMPRVLRMLCADDMMAARQRVLRGKIRDMQHGSLSADVRRRHLMFIFMPVALTRRALRDIWFTLRAA